MKPNTRWQIAFLVGITYLLASTWVLFGSEALTGLAAAGALIISVVHALAAPADTSEDPSKWLTILAKRALQVTTFLMVSTLGIWIASIATTIVWARKAYVDNHIVSISGLALTHENVPIGLAVVTLMHRQDVIRSQSTKEDGSFSFDKFLLDDNQFSVAIRWHGVSVSQPISAVSAKKGSLVFMFPAGASNSLIREFYFDFSGHTINFLLRGEMTPTWVRSMGQQPFILENDLFKYLKQLATTYRFTPGYFQLSSEEQEKQDSDAQIALSNRTRDDSFFVGGDPEPLGASSEKDDVAALAAGTSVWSLRINEDDKRGRNQTPFFWRFATRDDLMKIKGEPSSNVEFWRYVTKANFPPDFAYLIMYYYGGCTDGSWMAELVPRDLHLRVVVLENISNNPIEISSFVERHNAEAGIRDFTDDEKVLSKQELKHDPGFAGRWIRPGERILIPLEVLLKSDEDSTRSLGQSADLRRDWMKEHGGQPYPSIDDVKATDIVRIPPAVLSQYASADVDPRLESQFVLGPSTSVDAITVQGDDYEVRQREESSLTLLGSFELGSCPFVYTRDGAGDTWQNEGTILRGIKDKSRKTTDSHRLHSFDGSVMVLEREAEVSHLDAMWVDDIAPDGSTRRLNPTDLRLANVDGNEVVLHRGQRFTVVFKDFTPEPRHTYVLHSNGYYDLSLSSSAR
jgi:hypothetical protein